MSSNSNDNNSANYRMSYRDVAMHKVMLQDVIRTDAYEKAIAEVVKPAHTVMDFGCGTGILSMFAARAGAKQVVAVDRSPFIQTAKKIATQNGFDNIDFYHDDHETLALDKKVDVIVSEWMGHCLFYEAMLEPLLELRDKYLAEGGIMIPAQVSLHMGLVCDEEIEEDINFLKERPYDIDFAPIADAPLQQTDLLILYPEQILANTAHLGSLDMHTITKADSPRVFTGKVTPDTQAKVTALCGWFSTELSDGVSFGTGPMDSPTHWDQILFPLPEPFYVDPERELTITLSPLTEQVGKEQCWAWSISDGETTIRVNEQEQQQRAQIDVPQGKI
ncbi:MAG: class I SAM-dependent methyltransferase [Pseudomonadales bacterium]|nr:class I SAM-dependent methyltransferase [Pseudomonadales bacterium]